MKLRALAGVILLISLCSFTYLKNDIKNYYGISDTLTFNNTSYKLVASYHPNDGYYKQEYIPTGESPDHYNTMLIVDFYVTDQPVKRLVKIKENEITTAKKTDPVANFEQFENTELGEFLI